MSDPEMKSVPQAELEAIALIADPMADYLQTMPAQEAMRVLLYVITRTFLNIDTFNDVSKLEAFDKYMATCRHTLDMNIRAGL